MNTKNVLIAVLVLIVVALLARYVVFKDQIDQWGQGLERIDAWEQNYRAEHPDATDAEVDAAFDAGIANIKVWKERYLQEHPDATEADADAAFNAAWEKK